MNKIAQVGYLLLAGASLALTVTTDKNFELYTMAFFILSAIYHEKDK